MNKKRIKEMWSTHKDAILAFGGLATAVIGCILLKKLGANSDIPEVKDAIGITTKYLDIPSMPEQIECGVKDFWIDPNSGRHMASFVADNQQYVQKALDTLSESAEIGNEKPIWILAQWINGETD